ncbi:MAG: TetR/AcrR family transcriptional regulator, partial [Lachnospiraceae bacterium]|nr:TetR/AcrR family transcriptional regulator [Lachnospiraceae bacterium]
MFRYLVKDTLDVFHEMAQSNEAEMETGDLYNPFQEAYAAFWLEFIFAHYDGLKLLICCSKGSAYESFEEQMIEYEEAGDKRYYEILKASGRNVKEISDLQWHMLATAYVHLIFEIVRHDMSREEAIKHMRFVSELLYPGWKDIYDIK